MTTPQGLPPEERNTSDKDFAVELKTVSKAFGDLVAVRNIDLNIHEGSFVTLLGPSGCGKTTVLRMIAGLETATGGEIWIRGRRVNEVPIHKRNIGLVFQNYALFPHKTIFDNVAFGLKYRNVAKAEIGERVRQALELVRLPGVEKRFPAHLSGGQQQRIALARAIVIRPDVLLLDEPLSALDANLREDMRVELKRIQHQLGITTIFVTHDQSEALAMSDSIVVMREGRIEQTGRPADVYNRPATEFVARFLGNANILPGHIEERGEVDILVSVEGLGALRVSAAKAGHLAPGQEARVVIRAEHLRLAAPDAAATKESTRFVATVEAIDYQGQVARYFVTIAGRSMQAINAIDERPFGEGEVVSVHIRTGDCVLLPAREV